MSFLVFLLPFVQSQSGELIPPLAPGQSVVAIYLELVELFKIWKGIKIKKDNLRGSMQFMSRTSRYSTRRFQL